MNFENVSALSIRLCSAYQFYACIDAIVYVLPKQATDPAFSLYHFYAIMIGARIFFGILLFLLAVPLGKKFTRGLIGLPESI